VTTINGITDTYGRAQSKNRAFSKSYRNALLSAIITSGEKHSGIERRSEPAKYLTQKPEQPSPYCTAPVNSETLEMKLSISFLLPSIQKLIFIAILFTQLLS